MIMIFYNDEDVISVKILGCKNDGSVWPKSQQLAKSQLFFKMNFDLFL